MSILSKIRCFLTVGQGVTGSSTQVNLLDNPVQMFDSWFDQAKRSGLLLPESMTVASASLDSKPSARIVLLKSFDRHGFVFFTNYSSRKGGELVENPQAALLFHWAVLQRQVRIEGRVEKVSQAESLAYFQSRPRGSQIGAWASYQSSLISDRSVLNQAVKEMERRYEGKSIPLPPFWGGFRVIPEHMEFWQGRTDRLHDRFVFDRKDADGQWELSRLSP